jgi:transposase
MPSAVPLRTDFSASELRRLAKRSNDNNQSRRLLSLAAVLEGMNRTDAARIGGMDRQTLRDWVHRFNEAGPEGLLDNWASGPAPRLSPDQKAELAAIVEADPDREVDGVVRWRRVDLKRVIAERFGVDYHERHVGTLLKKIGFSHISAASSRAGCPDHRGFQKNFSRALSVHLAEVPEGTPIEIWFQML